MNRTSQQFLSLLVSAMLVGSLLVGCSANKITQKESNTEVTETEKMQKLMLTVAI
ncbi:MAG: hypothetical protein N2B06_13085 [Clostridium sp.]